MEPNQNKLSKAIRTVLFMVRKSFTKTKLIMLDLNFLMKRGKIVGKSLNDIVFSFSCRSSLDDIHMSFISPVSIPKEYEFSCSDSPAYHPYIPFHVSKRKTYHRYDHHTRRRRSSVTYFRREEVEREPASPSVISDLVDLSPLIGPVGRRVRITDSPFSVEEVAESSFHVNKAADEFIESFYNQLRLQKLAAAIEAGDYYG